MEKINVDVELLDIIKGVAMSAFEGGKPTEIRTGIVKSVAPLSIQMVGGFTVSEAALVLTNNVKDHDVEVEIEWDTETASSHRHGIKGTKVMKIKKGLKIGEKVLLVRMQGGNKYYVIDRL